MGAKTLAKRLDIPMKEAKDLIKKFFSAFPMIKKFLDTNADLALHNLYSESAGPAYVKRFYDEPRDPREEASIGRNGKNMPRMSGHVKQGELRGVPYILTTAA